VDAVILQAVLPEIRDELVGRPVTKVELLGKYGVLLRFGGARRDLFLSAHPELSRVGLVEDPPAVGDPRPASDNLAEPLLGAILEAAEREPAGRVVRLELVAEAGRHRNPRLVGELIPRFANVVLVGNDRKILWARRSFLGVDRPRQVGTGHPYVDPAPDPGLRLPDLDEPTIAARLAEGEGTLASRLPRGWGGGPHGPARVFEEAGLDVAARLAALAAAAREPAPRLARRDADGELVLFPADPGEVPGWRIEPAGPANAVVGEYYASLEEGETADTLLADLRRTLVRRRGRAAKALRQIDARRAEADRESEFRRRAELLTAHLGRLRRGMKSVTLPAFDGSGDVEIELDPKKDGRGNVEALFKKARRLARGREELEVQRRVQEAELAEAERGLEGTDPPPSPDELRELAATFAPELLDPGRTGPSRRAGRGAAGSRGAGPTEKPRHPSLPEGFLPRVYELPGGWVVWVGRNARQNDELTHRRASQRDLWFHARGAQGSHTVLRMGSGKGEPPREILEAAASIAAWHSKARRSSLVPVAYTEKRYVRRPRKAPVGTALMIREKVLMVPPRLPEGAED
jgi:predicted ribosome quality control (RQC) complex YloA/Tae2 family protein